MNEWFFKIIKPVADVKPEERFRTAVMFFYFFLTIALVYILKPLRNALFLSELGAKNLRYVYIGEGIFLMFVVAALVWYAKKVSRRTFYLSTLGFYASNLVLFWVFFHLKVPYLSAFFYVWVSSFTITATTQFWMLANDVYKPEAAKRLFGLIISGGSIGGIIGGMTTHRLLHSIKAEELLLVAAGVIVACAIFVAASWKSIYPENIEKAHTDILNKPSLEVGSKILLGSSYLIMLALLVIFAKMSSTIIDNQFNRMVELTYAGKEARGAFLAAFMSWLNVASFISQLFITGFCLRFLGMKTSLRILPLGLLLFCGATVLYPVLLSAALLEIFDGTVNYSIQQASKEVLYLPLTSEVRYRVKPVIDMLGFRVAKSLSGIYIAVAAPLLALPDEKLGLLVLFLVPFWLFLVWQITKKVPAAEGIS